MNLKELLDKIRRLKKGGSVHSLVVLRGIKETVETVEGFIEINGSDYQLWQQIKEEFNSNKDNKVQ